MGGILFFAFMIILTLAIIVAATWYKWRVWKYDCDLKHTLEEREQAHRHEIEGRTLLFDRGPQQQKAFLYSVSNTEYPPMEAAQPGAYEGLYPYQQSQPPQPLG